MNEEETIVERKKEDDQEKEIKEEIDPETGPVEMIGKIEMEEKMKEDTDQDLETQEINLKKDQETKTREISLEIDQKKGVEEEEVALRTDQSLEKTLKEDYSKKCCYNILFVRFG